MQQTTDLSQAELGYDIPARPGMREAEVQTPALILDLDALERNIVKMGDYARAHNMRHRVHGKMHKSVDIAKLQIALAGADGVCCQKVSEAEVFVRGGIKDVLLSNQVQDPAKIARLARLPKLGARVSVCVDDLANIADLSRATKAERTTLEVLVERDCGAARCGASSPEEAVALARAIDAADGLIYGGLQAYQGSAQHVETYEARKATAKAAIDLTHKTVEALTSAGLPPKLVTGGGTGTYEFESNSGVYNELQCGSYAFMDADYGRIQAQDGQRLDAAQWENALFLLTQVMSYPVAGRAIVDAGLKAQAVDSGLPRVFGRAGLDYARCSDEHGEIEDPEGQLKLGDKLRLIPGHCDPTVNLHDWYVGVRAGVVEQLWPVSARGKLW